MQNYTSMYIVWPKNLRPLHLTDHIFKMPEPIQPFLQDFCILQRHFVLNTSVTIFKTLQLKVALKSNINKRGDRMSMVSTWAANFMPVRSQCSSKRGMARKLSYVVPRLRLEFVLQHNVKYTMDYSLVYTVCSL